MKKLLSLAILLGMLSAYAGADQSGESWSRLYRRMPDIKQKYSIIQNIAPLDDRTLEPFLLSSLNQLVYGDLAAYRTDRAAYDDWEILTRALVHELGDIKAQSAGAVIWDVVRSAETPLLKAEGLIALGMIRASEYAPEIALILRNLNFNTRTDRDNAEIEAYGAVISLEKLKDQAGFEPLFYAAVGWYQDRVTEAAENALLSLNDDPTPQLILVMKSTANYTEKRQALALGMKSNAPAASKVSLAAECLREGLKYAETDYQKNRDLENLRIEAINALITLDSASPDSPALINKAIDRGRTDEKLIAIQALSVDGGDIAVEFLAGRLSSFNLRQSSGLALNREELILIRQLVFALGEARNPLGLESLQEMAFVDYTPAILRQADEAIAKINGN